MLILNKTSKFVPENINTLNNDELFIILKDQEFLTTKNSILAILDKDELKWSQMEESYRLFVGYLEDKPCYVISLIPESPLMKETTLTSLRNLLGTMGDNIFNLCSRSLQISNWFKQNQFCGSCGKKMKIHKEERAMFCSCNKLLIYPRISPCVIMLVTKGEELLLARNNSFPPKFYSTLAGFIEPGETAEEAVHREIMEEVHIKVKDIAYFSSQSWPFPSQLMLGFNAIYSEGEIAPDGLEIDSADWFHYSKLPQVPTGDISISGRLIENFVDKFR